MNKFNVRVYGLLINQEQKILITDEQLGDFKFTKFPGGGLEKGEGLIDALKREFIEECNLEIEILEHYYTTDFFVQSIFSEEQLIAVYYLIKPKNNLDIPLVSTAFDFDEQNSCKQCFRLVDLKTLTTEDLTFPVDKHVIKLMMEHFV
ncbi:NUDIX domain-containing protein [Pedobacter aquae]|uniref:NUDIX domain-containing protein n=1 Tax=Pedobacter aquae TaxID=2605747 RepID=A0A5C0VFM8_9SPHI|nr:NUDIX domain-containing protein [Pedobacter aquae]QEK51475.1 NUDIX domain-containing protein [Pedobacter aquae]